MEKYLKMHTFNEYHERTALMSNFARLVANELEEVLIQKDKVTLALPGGSTPGPFFKKLSQIELHWDRVVVIPTDERFVPETDPSSNLGFIKNNLKRHYAHGVKIVNFFKPDHSLENLAASVSEDLKFVLPIDICLSLIHI